MFLSRYSILSSSFIVKRSIEDICVPKIAFNLPVVSAASENVSNLLANPSKASVSTPAARAAAAIFPNILGAAAPYTASDLLAELKPFTYIDILTPIPLAANATSLVICIASSVVAPKLLRKVSIIFAPSSAPTPNLSKPPTRTPNSSFVSADKFLNSFMFVISAAFILAESSIVMPRLAWPSARLLISFVAILPKPVCLANAELALSAAIIAKNVDWTNFIKKLAAIREGLKVSFKAMAIPFIPFGSCANLPILAIPSRIASPPLDTRNIFCATSSAPAFIES